MKIAALHITINAIQPLVDAAKQYPDVQIFNYLDDYHMQCTRGGGVTKESLRGFTRMLFNALDEKPDGVIIGCNIYTPFAQELQAFSSVPVVGVDKVMLEKAATCGKKVGILATNSPSGNGVVKRINSIAAEHGLTPNYELNVVSESVQYQVPGKQDKFIEVLAAAAAQQVANGCEVILLAQITMACAADAIRKLGVEVLTSPEEGLKNLISLIEQQKK